MSESEWLDELLEEMDWHALPEDEPMGELEVISLTDLSIFCTNCGAELDLPRLWFDSRAFCTGSCFYKYQHQQNAHVHRAH
jgi:hypothetical protein